MAFPCDSQPFAGNYYSDASVVNVTLPAIRKEFNATLVDLEWISATYAVVYGSFIITGRLGDMLGRAAHFHGWYRDIYNWLKAW